MRISPDTLRLPQYIPGINLCHGNFTRKRKNIEADSRCAQHPGAASFPHSEGTQSVYSMTDEDPVVVFAEEFTKLQGRFSFCENDGALKNLLAALIAERKWTKIFCREKPLQQLLAAVNISLHDDLASCDASLTGCEFLVARTGTIVLSAAQESGRTASVYAPVHICIASAAQVKRDVRDALLALKEKYGSAFPSFVTFASGPSRTADIEKTLVTGVHGPKEVFCFLTEDK